MKSMIRLENVTRKYNVGDNIIKALNHLSFEVEDGEFCIILGPSGSGKTTTLNIIGGMDSPTSGKVFIEEENIAKFNKRKIDFNFYTF